MLKSFSLHARDPGDLEKKGEIKLSPPNKIYFMGICGTAMAPLACFFKKLGFEVSGSDHHIYPPMSGMLKELEIPVFNYNKKNIKKDFSLVVVGNVIGKDHEEMKEVEGFKLPILSFPETLEQTVLKDKKNLVVAGTHGKSTSSSLLSHVFVEAGKDPGFFIGAKAKNLKSSFKDTNGEHFILEGDEYDTAFFAKKPKFSFYSPHSSLITSIEFDHGDIYKDIDQIKKLFLDLALQTKDLVLACGEDKNIKAVFKDKKRVIFYGFDSKYPFSIKNRKTLDKGQSFDIVFEDKSYPCFLPLLGRHNALNALGVFALSLKLGLSPKDILKAFESFKGLRKRLEYKAEYKGAKIYEDFAHHPTEIEAGVQALKELKSEGRVIALFEPRSYTARLSLFQDSYVQAFKEADLIFLAPIYDKKRIPEEKRLNVKQLVNDLKEKGKKAFFFEDFKSLEQSFKEQMKKGDTAVFMSSGDFNGLIKKIVKT